MIYNPTFKPGDNLPADVVNNVIESIKEDEGTLSTLSGEVAKKVNADEIYSNSQIDEKLNKKANLENSEGGFEGGNGTHTTTGGAIGNKAFSQSGGAVGKNASANSGGGAVGENAFTYNGFAGGYNAKTGVEAPDAIQLGTGTNNNMKTLQIYNYQLMDANGHIPNDRMPTKQNKLEFDNVPMENSTNVVNSGTIYSALNNKVDKETGKQLSTNDYTDLEKAEVAKIKDKQNILTFDDIPIVDSANPVKSSGIATELNKKVDKVAGKGLSTNDYTDADKHEVSTIKLLQRKIGKNTFEDQDTVSCVLNQGNDINVYKNNTVDISQISITILPITYDIDFVSNYSFKTGTTAPTLTQELNSNTLVWLGTDCELKNNNYTFSPAPTKSYDIMFYYNGVNFVGLVTGYSI